jgi:3-isopropylmalate dehydrogenase
MLLDWIGARRDRPDLARAGARIDAALEAALADPALRTPDLGGAASTDRFARAVASRLA